MERFFGFLIIGHIFLVVTIIGKPVTDADVDCEDDFQKYYDLVYKNCPNKNVSSLFSQIPPLNDTFRNEKEIAAELKSLCDHTDNQMRCIHDTMQNLKSLCFAKNSLKYFWYHIADEEIHQLCDNNAEGYKKLIADDGIETYLYGIQNEDYVNCIENTDLVQHSEESTHNQICMEIAIKHKCLQQFQSNIAKNVHVGAMKLEVNSRLMALFECAEME